MTVHRAQKAPRHTHPRPAPAAHRPHPAPPRRATGHSNVSSFEGRSLAPRGELSPGARGPAVKQLQDELVRRGYMTQAQVSTGPGVFGPKTEAALKRFQSDHGVPATGNYGPLTRRAMESAAGGWPSGPTSTPSQPAGAGSTQQVQQLMRQHPVGSYAGQCSGFTATALGIPGFPRADGLGPANGNQMVDFLVGRHGFHRVSRPQPGDAFSMNIGRYGHTGIVVGVHGNMVEVIDSNWNLDQRIHVHQIPLSQFSGFARRNGQV